MDAVNWISSVWEFLVLAWPWMLDQIGGYTGLLALLLLMAFTVLVVAYVGRALRRMLDARSKSILPVGEIYLSYEEAEALTWLRSHPDVASPMAEPVHEEEWSE